MNINIPLFALSLCAVAINSAAAQSYTSTYTKLNFDQHCVVLEEYELGVSAKCSGYNNYPVYFSEGDLRAMVRFGHTTPKTDRWESFGQFNNVGNTIEWRLSAEVPTATILRWHIDTEDSQGNRKEGQVLVVSTVANYDNPDNACIAGYVDALANSNANALARNVADTIAIYFKCGVDSPKFYGDKGPYSGSPTNFTE